MTHAPFDDRIPNPMRPFAIMLCLRGVALLLLGTVLLIALREVLFRNPSLDVLSDFLLAGILAALGLWSLIKAFQGWVPVKAEFGDMLPLVRTFTKPLGGFLVGGQSPIQRAKPSPSERTLERMFQRFGQLIWVYKQLLISSLHALLFLVSVLVLDFVIRTYVTGAASGPDYERALNWIHILFALAIAAYFGRLIKGARRGFMANEFWMPAKTVGLFVFLTFGLSVVVVLLNVAGISLPDAPAEVPWFGILVGLSLMSIFLAAIVSFLRMQLTPVTFARTSDRLAIDTPNHPHAVHMAIENFLAHRGGGLWNIDEKDLALDQGTGATFGKFKGETWSEAGWQVTGPKRAGGLRLFALLTGLVSNCLIVLAGICLFLVVSDRSFFGISSYSSLLALATVFMSYGWYLSLAAQWPLAEIEHFSWLIGTQLQGTYKGQNDATIAGHSPLVPAQMQSGIRSEGMLKVQVARATSISFAHLSSHTTVNFRFLEAAEPDPELTGRMKDFVTEETMPKKPAVLYVPQSQLLPGAIETKLPPAVVEDQPAAADRRTPTSNDGSA